MATHAQSLLGTINTRTEYDNLVRAFNNGELNNFPGGVEKLAIELVKQTERWIPSSRRYIFGKHLLQLIKTKQEQITVYYYEFEDGKEQTTYSDMAQYLFNCQDDEFRYAVIDNELILEHL